MFVRVLYSDTHKRFMIWRHFQQDDIICPVKTAWFG